MNEDDPRNIADLAPTQYVGLNEVVQYISDELSASNKETRATLNGYGLSSLRPIATQSGSDWTEIEDTSDKQLTDAIIHLLGGIPFSELSKDAQYYSSHCVFHWGIPTLFDWCNYRKLPIPVDWNQWMSSTYRLLNDRGLIRSKSEATGLDTTSRPSSGGQKTQRRNSTWNSEYRKICKEYPDKSDTWISNKISKLPIAQGCAAETIRKNMKK